MLEGYPILAATPKLAGALHSFSNSLQATDDERLLYARATLQCKADCKIPFMAGWASC